MDDKTVAQQPWKEIAETAKNNQEKVRSLTESGVSLMNGGNGGINNLSDANRKLKEYNDVKQDVSKVQGIVDREVEGVREGIAKGLGRFDGVGAGVAGLVGASAVVVAEKNEEVADHGQEEEDDEEESHSFGGEEEHYAFNEENVGYNDDDDDDEVEEDHKKDEFYRANLIADNNDDTLLDRIRLQAADLKIGDDLDEGLYQDSGNFIHSSVMMEEEFNFNKLLRNQYLIFSDYDISDILDYIFTLNQKYSHKVTYPAAVIYQCVRYADHIKNNDILVENFLNLAFTKIRSNITSSMTGITNVLKDGDIVLQSYWVSVVNFLYYYLCKDEGFFTRYPKVLQELIITLNSLILELANCLKFRMQLIIDDSLLNYTNIPDLSETLYKNDWNFFKKKNVKHSTFDDIYKMLYPPSLKEQMKPSPIKIVQTLGALIYVLDIHQVHPLIKQQSFAIVFQWLSFTIFNRIISNKRKYLSRKKAIQIRLNLSTLEDWTRSNDLKPKIPDIDEDIYKKFPYNLTEGEHFISGNFNPKLTLQGVLFYFGDGTNPSDLKFYHESMYDIFRFFFEPLYELLQWLQCLTSLETVDELLSLLPNLTKLNQLQLLLTVDKYRYEVDEAKVPKEIRSKIQSMTKTEDQNLKRIPYLNKDLINLNPDYVYPVALATLNELVDEYGSGIGGIYRERAIKYQPFLPFEIIDAIDEIHEQRSTDQGREEKKDYDEQGEDDEEGEEDEDEAKGYQEKNQDDGIFSDLQIPSSLMHKKWGEDENEINPW